MWQFYLVVAGDGIDRAHWERYAAEYLPGHVAFLGHVRERKMLATLYGNADIFVHPNPHEPFGIAPLEAMASGLPLLAPDSGGVTTYANLENAWTVSPSVECFAGAVAEIVNDPVLVLQKTQKALATAQTYRWDKVAAAFLDLYQDLHGAFQGHPAALPADFYSTPAQPGSARFAHWTSQLAQKMFAGIAHIRESDMQNLKREVSSIAPSRTEGNP